MKKARKYKIRFRFIPAIEMRVDSEKMTEESGGK